MGAGNFGKVVAVAVDGRKNSEAAFQAAVAVVGPEDRLLILFGRPAKCDSIHYNFVMKEVQKRYDAESNEILGKYSALAAEAKVNYEAVEVTGNHPREAVLRECYLHAADELFEAAPTFWERVLRDHYSYNFCPVCNPYLRPGGRFATNGRCQLKHAQQPPCPITQVSA